MEIGWNIKRITTTELVFLENILSFANISKEQSAEWIENNKDVLKSIIDKAEIVSNEKKERAKKASKIKQNRVYYDIKQSLDILSYYFNIQENDLNVTTFLKIFKHKNFNYMTVKKHFGEKLTGTFKLPKNERETLTYNTYKKYCEISYFDLLTEFKKSVKFDNIDFSNYENIYTNFKDFSHDKYYMTDENRIRFMLFIAKMESANYEVPEFSKKAYDKQKNSSL